MAKNILIPVDFRVASLNTLKLALEQNTNEQIHAILFYCELLDDSITELLFYSDEKIIKTKCSSEFNEALEIIKNRYEGILVSITIRLLHSKNKNYLLNFLGSNLINEIIIPENYQLQLSRRAINLIPTLKKFNYPIHSVSWKDAGNTSEQEQLITLFN